MPDEFLTLRRLPEKDMLVVVVNHDSLEMADWSEFVKASEKLARSEARNLVLDLRKLRRILSIFIGTAVQLSAQARSRKRRFAVLARGHVADILGNVLGRDILEIVTDGRGPEEI
jgi:anti-anti-sigma regulatory factor